MSILQKKIVEKKFTQLFSQSEIILFFHFSPLKQTDWKNFHSFFFQKNLNVHAHILPRRLFSHFLQTNQVSDSYDENSSYKTLSQGPSCMFFCETVEDFQRMMSELAVKKTSFSAFSLLGLFLQTEKNSQKFTFLSLSETQAFSDAQKTALPQVNTLQQLERSSTSFNCLQNFQILQCGQGSVFVHQQSQVVELLRLYHQQKHQ